VHIFSNIDQNSLLKDEHDYVPGIDDELEESSPYDNVLRLT